ncbi:GroES-like protein [Daedaleopsis nitida]|nr:GroES-like protein [Daedaleopsis nitida]
MILPAVQAAIVLQSKQGFFAMTSRPVPHPTAGEVVVKNEASALNPVDWKIQEYGVFVEEYPAILGFDAAGIVAAVGEGVTTLKAGDRVVYQGILDSANDHATFQQYTLVPADMVSKVPESVSFDQASSVPLGLTTAAIGLYHQQGGPVFVPAWAEGGKGKYAGTPILFMGGASVVGSFAIQLAKLSGFSPIITTASPKNDALLRSYGATHVLDRQLPSDALRAEVLAFAGGPLSVVYDAISLPETQRVAYDLLAPNGTLLVVLPEEVKERSEGCAIVVVRGVVQFPDNLEFGKKLYDVLPALLEAGDVKPLNVQVLPGGLGAIVGGLLKMKNNEVSASKLVVRPGETA